MTLTKKLSEHMTGDATIADDGTLTIPALDAKLGFIDNSPSWGAGGVALDPSVTSVTIGDTAERSSFSFFSGLVPGYLSGFEFDLKDFVGGAFLGGALSAGGRAKIQNYGTVTGWEFTSPPYVGVYPIWHAGVNKMPAQADTTAADLAALKVDHNALLAKLRAAGLMSP